MEGKRSYYAVIPAPVRYDPNLPAAAKLLYGEITALCNDTGYCWASNEYFAKLYSTNKTTVQRWMKALEEKGYIFRQVKYKEGTKQIEKRYVQICGDPHLKNEVTPHRKNEQENNTVFNNIMSGTNGDPIPYALIIDHLNQKVGRSYKVTEKWKSFIRARWNEGQRLNDFKQVVDTKADQWLNNAEMAKYLRPQTLFGPKFDEYLQERPRETQLAQPAVDLEEQRRRLKDQYAQ